MSAVRVRVLVNTRDEAFKATFDEFGDLDTVQSVKTGELLSTKHPACKAIANNAEDIRCYRMPSKLKGWRWGRA